MGPSGIGDSPRSLMCSFISPSKGFFSALQIRNVLVNDILLRSWRKLPQGKAKIKKEFDFLFLTQVHQSSQAQLEGPAEILGNEDPSQEELWRYLLIVLLWAPRCSHGLEKFFTWFKLRGIKSPVDDVVRRQKKFLLHRENFSIELRNWWALTTECWSSLRESLAFFWLVGKKILN